jgi:hypothetical protein
MGTRAAFSAAWTPQGRHRYASYQEVRVIGELFDHVR